MNFLRLVAFAIGVFALALSGCASKRHVSTEYQELIQGQTDRTSKRTVLLFLFDGLPVSTLRDELSGERLPQIQKYFLAKKNKIYLARTPFPSLTFPGIGALLTGKPTEQNGLFGNIIFKNGEQVDFESPANFAKLNQMIKGDNVFSRLRVKGLKTASIDYSFSVDADVSVDLNDSEAALAILHKDYARVDAKLIESLRSLLAQTQAQQWPDFIFVHLLGIDFLSHDQGPGSQAVMQHLEFLDRELSSVFQVLNRAEASKEREIVALMTSDHGYDDKITKTLNLPQVLKRLNSKIEVLNEGRFAALYFPAGWAGDRKSSLMRELISHPLLDIVAYREADKIFVQSHSLESMIAYDPRVCSESSFAISVFQTENHLMKAAGVPSVCPEKLDGTSNRLYYPYFLSNLSHYFQSAGHPDALIIPKPGVAFKKVLQGQHGGPTVQEVFVPLLIHNGALSDGSQVPALWDLLKFM